MVRMMQKYFMAEGKRNTQYSGWGTVRKSQNQLRILQLPSWRLHIRPSCLRDPSLFASLPPKPGGGGRGHCGSDVGLLTLWVEVLLVDDFRVPWGGPHGREVAPCRVCRRLWRRLTPIPYALLQSAPRGAPPQPPSLWTRRVQVARLRSRVRGLPVVSKVSVVFCRFLLVCGHALHHVCLPS